MATPPIELWREAANWLISINVVSEDNNINLPGSSLKDFCLFLRNGVILCKVLHTLDSTSLDLRLIHQRPQNAQFLCLKNIRTFLRSAKHHFHLHDRDLFEPEMLFELTDFGRVLITLSMLSKCSKVQELGFSGFPSYSIAQDEEEANSSYLLLDDTVPSIKDTDVVVANSSGDDCGLRFLQKANESFPAARKKSKEEDAYESLCYVNLKLPREELHHIHHQLYLNLQHSLSSYNSCIADVFLKEQESLLIYGDYCANIGNAHQKLDDIRNGIPEVRRIIKVCESKMADGRHQLQDFLVVPLQRILKYHLLLQDLLKYTPESHHEYRMIKEAYEAMVDVAEYINEAKRDAETEEIIKAAQANITDMPEELSDLLNMGRLRLDGEIKIESHPDKTKSRYVFVFDKVLIMCKDVKGEKRVYKDHVMLDFCKVEACQHSGTNFGRKSTSFYLVENENKKTYAVIAKSEDIMKQWFDAVSLAIENICPPENQVLGHNFAMHSFKERNIRCKICHRFLKGRFFQGYMCSVCRITSHKSCLNKTGRCCDPELHPTVPMSLISDSSIWDYPWWVGSMSREDSETLLAMHPQGTFLVRFSEQREKYVISLKDRKEVKHMKIDGAHSSKWYSLSENCGFPSLFDLIAYFKENSFCEIFKGLDRRLELPIYRTALVKHSYISTSPSTISLQEAQRIVIINQDSSATGWWTGRSGMKIGLVPVSHLEVDIIPVW